MEEKKTHKVLDLVFTEEEGQECFVGSHRECIEFVEDQGGFMSTFEIIPLSKEEIEYHNSIN